MNLKANSDDTKILQKLKTNTEIQQQHNFNGNYADLKNSFLNFAYTLHVFGVFTLKLFSSIKLLSNYHIDAACRR